MVVKIFCLFVYWTNKALALKGLTHLGSCPVYQVHNVSVQHNHLPRSKLQVNSAKNGNLCFRRLITKLKLHFFLNEIILEMFWKHFIWKLYLHWQGSKIDFCICFEWNSHHYLRYPALYWKLMAMIWIQNAGMGAIALHSDTPTSIQNYFKAQKCVLIVLWWKLMRNYYKITTWNNEHQKETWFAYAYF